MDLPARSFDLARPGVVLQLQGVCPKGTNVQSKICSVGTKLNCVTTVYKQYVSLNQHYIVQDLRAKVCVGGQIAGEGVCHEVVGERKMFLERFYGPLVEVQV